MTLFTQADALELYYRVGPILIFLVAVTILTEFADRTGTFDVAAHYMGKLARGNTLVLYVYMSALATITTVFLSLDTTAVLLTPIAIALAQQLKIKPLPFAMLSLYLANTASLLLPVSNLTNLLATTKFPGGSSQYIQLMWAPAVAAIVVTVALMIALHRKDIVGSFEAPTRVRIENLPLFWLSTGICIALGPLFALGLEPAVVTPIACAILALGFALRANTRQIFRSMHLPWQPVVLVSGLFLLIQVAHHLGLPQALGYLTGTHGTGFSDLLRLAAGSAVAANVMNNLPAYLALEPLAQGDTTRLGAILIGTNIGPMLLMWGSLATILWAECCRRKGLNVSAWHLAKVASVCVPVLLLASVAALYLV